jgi:hypothetical protein
MRILMTQRELIHRGGSEMFTIEVAVELRAVVTTLLFIARAQVTWPSSSWRPEWGLNLD